MKTGFFHHIGTFLLFAATILLLITSISAPVINSIALLRVRLDNGGLVEFGSWGYCLQGSDDSFRARFNFNDGDQCTGKHIGYNPAEFVQSLDNTQYNRAQIDTTKALTRVMVLHPVACALAFIAFLFAAGSGFCGAIFGAVTATVAWIVTLVVMATDFVLFGIIKNHINDDGSGSHAYFHTAMWTLLAAFICLFFGTLIVFFTCCSSRMHRQNHVAVKHETGYAHGTPVRKRHFWQRRTTRY
ncbi:hypothetical protein HYALB_00002232 [Hymenoscyphus albidus]|uniref:Pali-domain-containing protein n=1 Tax=Hymenoscyphus albidus TaxID=595503 RepID=A0A9N9Q4V4_9HELO|nr:hypothetical protein HYALB_00002232 [Hymenoscyphus albidus]